MNKKEKLYREIEKFTKWADQCHPTWSEERDNGEWELEYPHFEELCGAAEDVVNEYQKIMALHVLAKLNSPKLEAYLERAMKSDYKWLRKNAEELSAK